MRQELLTILFIRSSYKIRKINLLFIYYQIIKVLILLFMIFFIVLLTSVIFLKRSNNQLKQNIVKLENRNIFLNSDKPFKIDKINTKDPLNNNIVNYYFKNIISDIVDIQDLKIIEIKEEAKIEVSFKLANLDKANKLCKGYIIIGGFPEKGSQNEFVFYPEKIQLNDQKQIKSFDNGEKFAIRNFKNVNITLLKQSSFKIKNIVISIFSNKGDIICRKVKNVNDK